MKVSFLILLGIFALFSSKPNFPNKKFSDDEYQFILRTINQTVNTNSSFKASAYNRLAFIVDSFGPRLWGSENLERAIDEIYNMMITEGFENVRKELVPNITHWVRGQERLTLYSPRPTPTRIPMIGLGKSVGGNVTGELIVIQDFQDLEAKKHLIKGKIVLMNGKWSDYPRSVPFRRQGPSLSAKYGAIGFLLRSIASKSLASPHTGTIDYDPNYPMIPAAAISLEDADMFDRMQNRGQNITVNLYMEAQFKEPKSSYNLIGEIIGSTYPDQIILLGGHIDSWDTGPQTGANDDGGGVMVCFEAIRILLKLGLRPKRTLRFIAWSGEEMGGPYAGNQAYVKQHLHEMDKHVVAFESDEGTNNIYGFGFTGGPNGFDIVNSIGEYYFRDLNASRILFGEGNMTDTRPLLEGFGIPSMRNLVEDTEDKSYYFTYHHSAGDSMNVMDPNDMDRNVIVIAGMLFIIADIPFAIPRN
jgi:carboxypeptidase Q